MSPKYLVIYSKEDDFPERKEWLEVAWGGMPFSYIQDHERLCSAAYLDVKLNKWELNGEWSKAQVGEPWIRIEFFRGEALKFFLEENSARLDLGYCDGKLLVVLGLDEGWLDVDSSLLDRIVFPLSAGGACYLLGDEGLEFLDESHFDKILSVAELKVELSKGP